jgi:hypothetical protein
MRMALYEVIECKPVFRAWLDVPENVHGDSWLRDNGYSRAHTLRLGKIIEVTEKERRALHRVHDRLKFEGKLPSIAWKLLNNDA